MLCHYVSKHIVKSWKNQKGNFFVYDTNSNILEEIPYSDDLFAFENLLNQSEEKLFNHRIENHLANLSDNWESIELKQDSDLSNALFMYIFFQTERITLLNEGTSMKMNFLSATTKKYKQFSREMKKKYVIYANRLKRNSLFCSEVGIFCVPVNSVFYKKDDLAFAAAIRPNLYILLLNNEYDQSIAVQIDKNIGIYSLGVPNKLGKVLVPEEYVNRININATKNALATFIEYNKRMMKLIGLKNELIQKLCPTIAST